MYPARRYAVPDDVALVYDFVNSLDARHFRRNGVLRVQEDAFATPHQLQRWLVDHGVVKPGMRVSAALHRESLALRRLVRAFLTLPPADRETVCPETIALEKALRRFPVVVGWTPRRGISLKSVPENARGALAAVVAEVYRAALMGSLHRFKTCPAQECQWVFFDRTKPNTGKWCDSAICGNREKTKAYRRRKNP